MGVEPGVGNGFRGRRGCVTSPSTVRISSTTTHPPWGRTVGRDVTMGDEARWPRYSGQDYHSQVHPPTLRGPVGPRRVRRGRWKGNKDLSRDTSGSGVGRTGRPVLDLEGVMIPSAVEEPGRVHGWGC